MSDLIRNKSEIWNHFSIIIKNTAKCEYCSKTISYSGGGSGNLNRHMKKVHVTIPIEPLISENPQVQLGLPIGTNWYWYTFNIKWNISHI